MIQKSNRPPISAFYINRECDILRRQRMEEELARCAISAERFSAVEGRAVPDWLASFYDGRMMAGEVGCSASHLSVYKMIVERGLPFALVLEDDARINENCNAIIEQAVQAAPDGWDVIRLINSSKRPVQKVAQLDDRRQLVYYVRVPLRTAGLIVSNAGARKLLKPRLVKLPIDVEIQWSWRLDLNVLGIEPPIVTQASGVEFESSISVRTGHRKSNHLRRMIFNIRKMGLISYFLSKLNDRGGNLALKAMMVLVCRPDLAGALL